MVRRIRLLITACAVLTIAVLAIAVLACAGKAVRSTPQVETSCGGEKTVDRILVAYASKHGATAEIAERIGKVLCEAGLPADVRPADRVGDLTPYRAVVLGSAVYIGRWRKEAAAFLQANEKALAERAVWLFSSGPTGEGDPLTLLKGWRLPAKLQPVADRIRPRDIAVFHGKVDPTQLGFLEKMAIKHVDAPTGDFRDWEAITAWATSIATALKAEAPAAAAQPTGS